MSVSNHRNHKTNTIHHLVSRVAHRVYFLKDEERNDFIEMMRRAAEYCGVELLGWCIMTNHFHILVYLPEEDEVPEPEVIRRVGILKGKGASEALANKLSELRRNGDIYMATEYLDDERNRMYDIGSFMKILKQWFTMEYNRRYSHTGTLWESAYKDRVIKHVTNDISTVLCYIHLNPIRAAACSGFDEYSWSSLAAAVNGDEVAIKGLRFIYGENLSNDELFEVHHRKMSEALEDIKRQRAEDVARKRAAGMNAPLDPLTDEAMVIQATAHFQKVQAALIETKQVDGSKAAIKRHEIKMSILQALAENPHLTMAALSDVVDAPKATVCRYVNALKRDGKLRQEV